MFQKALRFAGDGTRPGVFVVATYDHGCAEFCPTHPRATSTLDEVFAGFGNQNVQKPHGFACRISLQLCCTRSSCHGAWPILDPVQILRVKGQKGRSRRSRAMIVGLLSTSSPWSQHFWYLDALALLTLFWLGHGWSGNGMLSSMNIIIVWAKIFW